LVTASGIEVRADLSSLALRVGMEPARPTSDYNYYRHRMNKQKIYDAIPHREPFLLVDEILEQSEDKIVCTKVFTGEEDFFAGHYPGFPLVPGVLLCEAAMQCGAILLSKKFADVEGKVPVATRLNNVRLKRMVRPGDLLRMEVTLDDKLSDAFFLTGKVTVEGKMAVRFEFACTAADMT